MNKGMINRTWVGLFTLSLLAACSEGQQSAPPAADTAAIDTGAAHQQVAAAVPESPAVVGKVHAGTVQAVLSGGGYTYLEVDADGRRLWLASNQAAAEIGQAVRWGDYAVMRNFHSKALDRDFEEILFVARVVPADAMQDTPQPQGGTVSQVIASGGYVYVEAEAGGRKLWLAAPVADVAVGDVVRWEGGSVMREFHSRSLDRSFDEILFVTAVSTEPAQ